VLKRLAISEKAKKYSKQKPKKRLQYNMFKQEKLLNNCAVKRLNFLIALHARLIILSTR